MRRKRESAFGPVASTPTAWRLLADVDERALASLRSARASAREVTLLQAAEYGEGIPTAQATGRTLPGLVLDLDATLTTCHSEKQYAAPTCKGGFGFHPLLCFLETRHRRHATVEDHIRCGKTTGFGRIPSRNFGVNAVWLELSLAAIDLPAWMRVLLLDGELAAAEPKKLRYRLLHVAGRLTRGGRRLHLRISATWPWRHELATAFHRLAALPRPAG